LLKENVKRSTLSGNPVGQKKCSNLVGPLLPQKARSKNSDLVQEDIYKRVVLHKNKKDRLLRMSRAPK